MPNRDIGAVTLPTRAVAVDVVVLSVFVLGPYNSGLSKYSLGIIIVYVPVVPVPVPSALI